MSQARKRDIFFLFFSIHVFGSGFSAVLVDHVHILTYGAATRDGHQTENIGLKCILTSLSKSLKSSVKPERSLCWPHIPLP